MSETKQLTADEARFLARFTDRGWLHGDRDDEIEQSAVEKGLRLRYLRRELNEVHFTPSGRKALMAA